MEIYLILASALLAEIIGTMAGFGSSTIFLPMALLFLDFNIALVLTAFLHLFGNLGRLAFFKKGINAKLAVMFGIPSIMLAIIGAYMVSLINTSILKAVLGLFLMAYAAYSLKFKDIKFKPEMKLAVVGGSLSGFLAGLIGTGGALRGAFLNSFGLEKAAYIATAALIALAVDATRIPIYIINGLLPQAYYAYLPALCVIAFAGSFIGKSIVSRIEQQTFRKIVFIAIAFAGAKFVLDTVPMLSALLP